MGMFDRIAWPKLWSGKKSKQSAILEQARIEVLETQFQQHTDWINAMREAQSAMQQQQVAAEPSTPAATPMREAFGVTVDTDEDGWRPLSGDSKRDLSPLTQSRMREMAVYLWESNLIANRIIELPLAYILAEGVTIDSSDDGSKEILSDFWNHPINQMDIKLTKKARELALYGEQCWPTFVNELTGAVTLGYLDPALIADVIYDPDNSEQPIGVITTKDKKGQYKKYRVIINGAEDVFTQRTQGIRANDFQDGECFYFKINDLSNGKRGRSDLLAQADWMDAYDQFLFGEIDRVQFLRAFIWDVTLTGATGDEVKQRAKEITAPGPNSTRVHNDNEKWEAISPGLQAGDTTTSAELIRNHMLGGATMPTTWYGGGHDANKATAGEMAEPTFKIFTMRQKFLQYVLEYIGKYCIRQNILATEGSEPDRNDPRLNVTVNFPEMISKDTTKYAAALQQVVVACKMALDAQFIDVDHAVQIVKAVADRLGIDMDKDVALKKIQDATSKSAEGDVFTTPDTNS